MRASNKPAVTAGHGARAAVAAAQVLAVQSGALGFTIRSTPHRRTVLVEDARGSWFLKLRDRKPRAALREWHWLLALPSLGLATPEPLCLLQAGACTGVATAALAGRPADVLLQQACVEGRVALAVEFACRQVAPRIRRLHDHGLFFRDLYWNHMFVASLEAGSEPAFLDVERVFRPWFRRRRWVVKDLAGLASSWPGQTPLRGAVRFLAAYQGSSRRGRVARAERRDLLRRCAAKAARIRAHAPKYG